MTAKEFLRQYEDADLRVKRLDDEYKKEMEMIDAIKSSADYDTQPRSKTLKRTVEDRAIRLADKAEKRMEAKLEAIAIRQEVFDVINKVKGDEGKRSEALYNKYIRLMTWEEVCVTMGYSWGGIHGLHKRALEEVDNILNCV